MSFEPACDRFEEQVPLGFGIAGRRGKTRQPLRELGYEPAELARARAEECRELGLRRVADDIRERLHERLVGNAEAVVAPAEQDEAAIAVDRAGELGREPRLPDTRLARDEHGPARSRRRFLPGDRDLLVLGVTSREREAGRDRERAGEWEVERAGCEWRPIDFARGDGIGKSLQRQFTDRPQRDLGATAEEHAHDVGHENLARGRRGAEPRGLDDG